MYANIIVAPALAQQWAGLVQISARGPKSKQGGWARIPRATPLSLKPLVLERTAPVNYSRLVIVYSTL